MKVRVHLLKAGICLALLPLFPVQALGSHFEVRVGFDRSVQSDIQTDALAVSSTWWIQGLDSTSDSLMPLAEAGFLSRSSYLTISNSQALSSQTASFVVIPPGGTASPPEIHSRSRQTQLAGRYVNPSHRWFVGINGGDTTADFGQFGAPDGNGSLIGGESGWYLTDSTSLRVRFQKNRLKSVRTAEIFCPPILAFLRFCRGGTFTQRFSTNTELWSLQLKHVGRLSGISYGFTTDLLRTEPEFGSGTTVIESEPPINSGLERRLISRRQSIPFQSFVADPVYGLNTSLSLYLTPRLGVTASVGGQETGNSKRDWRYQIGVENFVRNNVALGASVTVVDPANFPHQEFVGFSLRVRF